MSSKNDNQDAKKEIVKEETKQNTDVNNLNRNNVEEAPSKQEFYCPYMNYCSMMQDQSMFMYPREDYESNSELEGYRRRRRNNWCYPRFGCFQYYPCYSCFYPCCFCR